MPAAAELIAALGAVLDRLGCRWYVFGAQAVAVHGRARHTDDVDVTVEIDPRRARELWTALQAAGFAMRVDDPEEFLEQTHVLPLRLPRVAMDLDLIVAGSGLEASFLDRAALTDLGGVVAPVVSAEDLVIAKILAQRPKDIDDVRSVLAAQRRRLDLGYVRRILAELEEALGQSDLVPQLDLLLGGG